jgi:tetratricopeptide (TPR) repeat protein
VVNENNNSLAAAPADPEGILTLDQLLQRCLTCIDQRDYDRALQAGRQMLELEPAHIAGQHVVGLSLLRLGDAAQALPLLEQTAAARPRSGLVHWQRGQALLACGQPLLAIEAFDLAEALGVTDPALEQLRQDAAISAMALPGNWTHSSRLEHVLRQSVASGGRWIVGERALASPVFDNALLRQSTEAHARQLLASLGQLQSFAIQPRSGRIRLGFVGGDFFAQATAYLMVGFIEALDRRHFQVFAYDHGGPQPDSALRQRVLAAYDQVVDIAALSDDEAAARIYGDGIDILFSINQSRPRPAGPAGASPGASPDPLPVLPRHLRHAVFRLYRRRRIHHSSGRRGRL